jgi:hypothetical protein
LFFAELNDGKIVWFPAFFIPVEGLLFFIGGEPARGENCQLNLNICKYPTAKASIDSRSNNVRYLHTEDVESSCLSIHFEANLLLPQQAYRDSNSGLAFIDTVISLTQ